MIKYFKVKLRNEKGMVAVLALLGISAATLAIASTLVSISLNELRMASSGGAIDQTFYAAESGLNDALYRLVKDPVPGSHNFDYGNTTISIDTLPNPANPYQRIVEATATDENGNIRKVRVLANTDAFATGFDYAVQGGVGGVYLKNNSRIIGDIYSNGSILPQTGGSNKYIEGKAWVAGTNRLDSVQITGDVFAHEIRDSIIAGDAYYQAIDNDTTVSGSICPNSHCHGSNPDQPAKPFPLKDSDILKWKNDINASGNPVLGPDPLTCPAGPHYNGYYCVIGNTTLGNQKIDADFYLGSGGSLTLSGNIWITGDIEIANNGPSDAGNIRIDSSLGGFSTVVITDGRVEVLNNCVIQGSGDPRSFILLVSTSTSITPPAIEGSNNSNSIVFAAMKGRLLVQPGGMLNAVLAHEIFLENNSRITYNPNLSLFTIPTSKELPVGAAVNSWEEL